MAETSTFGKLGETVSLRLNEVVPAIHVPNARSITVAFISGVTLDGYDNVEASTSPYSGLDR
jgi:hypothetical protein